MARHKPPKVKKHWHFLKEMQRLVSSGDRPHTAAKELAKEHWLGLSRTKKSCIHWFEDNYRKFRDELDPVFAERTRTVKWLKTVHPPVKWLQEAWEKSLQPEELMRGRAAAEERERKAEVERWHVWFKDDPKAALAYLLDEMKKPYF
jgi:hypothetical protein